MIEIIFEEKQLDLSLGEYEPHGYVNDKQLWTYGIINGEEDKPCDDRYIREDYDLTKYYDAFVLSGFAKPSSLDNFLHSIFRIYRYYTLSDFDNKMSEGEQGQEHKQKIEEILMKQLNTRTNEKYSTVDDYLKSPEFEKRKKEFIEKSKMFTKNKIIKQNPQLAKKMTKRREDKIVKKVKKRQREISNKVDNAHNRAMQDIEKTYKTVVKRNGKFSRGSEN